MTRGKIIPARPARQAADPGRSAGQTPPEWNGRPSSADAALGLMCLAEWLQSEAAFCWRATDHAGKARQAAEDRFAQVIGLAGLSTEALALHGKCGQLARGLAQLGPGPADPAAVVKAALVGGRLAAEVGDLVSRVRAAVGPP